MLAIKLRVDEAAYKEIHQLHPGYGEVQRVVRDLVRAYLVARKATRSEIDALATAVLGRVR